MNIQELLLSFEGFSDYDGESIDSIAQNTCIEFFTKDQVIVQQGVKLDHD